MRAVVTIETPELGDRSYLAHDGDEAVVVDPQRDIDRILAAASAAGVRITHVAETHLHNDYVSGGSELARTTGAQYLVGASEQVRFERRPVADGEVIPVGRMSLRVVATPGHTPGHLSYVLGDGGADKAVFSGGSLLFGSVGRTDLVDPDRTQELARSQYRSARALASGLSPDVRLLPTHGFGSFCSPGSTGGAPEEGDDTISAEAGSNPALLIEDEDTFVERLLAGYTAYPRYYAEMSGINTAGPQPIDLTPARRVSAEEIHQRIGRGEWIVDLRDRKAFARKHIVGTVSFEHGNPFSTYLGWVIPWGAPVTLISDSPARIERAQRDLARIGIDRPAGAASGTLADLLPGGATRGYEVSDFVGLAKEMANGSPLVLDVRRDDEWDAGHLEGAIHIFLADLPQRMHELPAGEIWVHCASSYRAAVAASILDRAGRPVVVVLDEWANVIASGLPIVR